jgi:hypothetical protein
MELYDVVKFAHIAVLLAAIALAGTLHATEWLMPRAKTVGELRLLARPQKLGVLFVPVIALLLLLGAWLLKLSQDDGRAEYSFSDGWVWTAVVALVVLFACGGGIMGPHADKLNKAVDDTPDGPVTPELKAMAAAPVPWVVGHFNTFLAISVASNMVNKPDAPVAVLVLVVGTSVGAAIGVIGSRRARA